MKRRIVFGLVASITLAVTLGISSVITTSGGTSATGVTISENVGIHVPSGTGASVTYRNEEFPRARVGDADVKLHLEVMDTFGEGAVADFGYDVLAHQLQQAKLQVMETFGEGAIADIGYEVLIPRVDREKGDNAVRVKAASPTSSYAVQLLGDIEEEGVMKGIDHLGREFEVSLLEVE